MYRVCNFKVNLLTAFRPISDTTSDYTRVQTIIACALQEPQTVCNDWFAPYNPRALTRTFMRIEGNCIGFFWAQHLQPLLCWDIHATKACSCENTSAGPCPELILSQVQTGPCPVMQMENYIYMVSTKYGPSSLGRALS